MAADEYGNNVLHWAVSYEKVDQVVLLVDRGVNLLATNLEGKTAADTVRDSIEGATKAIETGLNSYGQEVSAERIESMKERLVAKEEILKILEG